LELSKVIILTALACLAGCSGRLQPEQPSNAGPALAAAIVSIDRADAKLKQAEPGIDKAEPRTLVQQARVDLLEAKGGVEEAEVFVTSDQKTIISLNKKLAEAQSTDPLKVWLQRLAIASVGVAILLSIATFFVPLIRGKLLLGAGVSLGLGLAAGALAKILSTLYMIAYVFFGVIAVTLLVFLVLYIIHCWKEHGLRSKVMGLINKS
jgi:hypothetical protein